MMCCRGGQVQLPLFEKGEEGSEERKIHDAWTAQDRKGSVMRKYARPINNALALASQTVRFNAPAGTGKTFCANALLNAVRGMGKHAIPVASSGIAAVLLKGGRTFHSRFKAPLSMGKDSNPFNVSVQSALAKRIERASLILWDEAPMMDEPLLPRGSRRDASGCDE